MQKAMSNKNSNQVPENDAARKSTLNGLLSVNRSAVESLLYGSEALTTLGFGMVSLAHKICPEHYDEFHKLFAKHHNANCGPLHRYTKDLLRDKR